MRLCECMSAQHICSKRRDWDLGEDFGCDNTNAGGLELKNERIQETVQDPIFPVVQREEVYIEPYYKKYVIRVMNSFNVWMTIEQKSPA